MFGNHQRTLDEKNRVVLPSKLRDSLGQICFITIGPDKVLEIRGKEDFGIFRDKLLSPNMLNAKARTFARLLLGNTIDMELDKAGRITLSEDFLNRAGITKEVTFVGVGTKIEIWATEAFDKFQKQFEGENSIDILATELLKDGINL